MDQIHISVELNSKMRARPGNQTKNERKDNHCIENITLVLIPNGFSNLSTVYFL